MGEMNAVVVHAYGDLRYEKRPRPKAGPGEVVIEVGGAGICAADRKIYSGHAPWKAPFPFIPGHEFVGTVVELGEEAGEKLGLEVGDTATAELIIPCRQCYYCQRGFYHLCINSQVLGIGLDGGWAEYMKFPARSLVHKVPRTNRPLTELAMIEPVSCAVYAVERSAPKLEDVVVIAGLGPIGMSILQVLRMRSPRLIVALTTKEAVSKLALELGADHAFNVRELSQEEVVSRIMDLTQGLGCDLYMEASGNPESLALGFEALRKRGRLFVFGVYGANADLDFNAVGEFKELEIIGGHLSPNAYPLAIQYLVDGRVNASEMVSRVFPLREFQEAVELRKKFPAEAIVKVVFDPSLDT